MMRHGWMFGVAGGALLLAQGAAAQTYTFTTYKAPMSGSTIYVAVADNGAVLSQVSSAGSTNCTLVLGAAKTVISDPNAAPSTTTCLGVGNGGLVVGYYQAPGQPAGSAAAFSYQNGTYTEFAPSEAVPAMGGTQLNGVSGDGLFVGTYSDAKGYYHIFKTRSATDGLQHVTIAGHQYLLAVGVNDNGVVIAQDFNRGGAYQASYYVSGGSATLINYPGSVQTVCHDVNDSGQVACHYADTQGMQHGFVYNGESNTYSGNIDAPTTTGGTLLLGINASGRVVGTTTPNPQTSIRLGLVGKPAGQ